MGAVLLGLFVLMPLLAVVLEAKGSAAVEALPGREVLVVPVTRPGLTRFATPASALLAAGSLCLLANEYWGYVCAQAQADAAGIGGEESKAATSAQVSWADGGTLPTRTAGA